MSIKFPYPIKAIAAHQDDRGIGLDGELLFKLRDDMEHFKTTTYQSVVIMGRKTYDSIGSPLPFRLNIVVSRQPRPADLDETVLWVGSPQEALKAAGSQRNYTKVFVIGGAELYNELMGYCEEAIVTMIYEDVAKADAFFPELALPRWAMIDVQTGTSRDSMRGPELVPYKIVTYRNTSVTPFMMT